MKAHARRLLAIMLLLSIGSSIHAQLQLNPNIDTFLSSPRPDGIGDGTTTCCNANPVPFDELLSSHNVMEVDTNQGGNGPVEPLMYFDLSTEIEEGRGTLLERFAATEGATATLRLAIVNGFDPLTLRRVTVDWLSVEGGGEQISRSTFPGAPIDQSISAYVPGENIESLSTTTPDPSIPDQAQGVVQIDVTNDILAWGSGSENYGWAFSPGASQGGTIIATENEDIPLGLVEGIEFTEADLPFLRPALLLNSPDGLPLKPTAFIGDFDRSGTVDLTDFLTLARNLNVGTIFEQGDNNSDGIVDLRDFVEFRAALTAQNSMGVGAVPEPQSFPLLVVTSLLALAVVRQRHA